MVSMINETRVFPVPLTPWNKMKEMQKKNMITLITFSVDNVSAIRSGCWVYIPTINSGIKIMSCSRTAVESRQSSNIRFMSKPTLFWFPAPIRLLTRVFVAALKPNNGIIKTM